MEAYVGGETKLQEKLNEIDIDDDDDVAAEQIIEILEDLNFYLITSNNTSMFDFSIYFL